MLYLIKKEYIFNEDWNEFILCDWNQLLGSKVSHTESGDPARTKDYEYNASARRKGETFLYRYEVNGKWFSDILNFVYHDVIQKRVGRTLIFWADRLLRSNSRQKKIRRLPSALA